MDQARRAEPPSGYPCASCRCEIQGASPGAAAEYAPSEHRGTSCRSVSAAKLRACGVEAGGNQAVLGSAGAFLEEGYHSRPHRPRHLRHR